MKALGERDDHNKQRKLAILKDGLVNTVLKTFSFAGRTKCSELFTYLVLSGVVAFFAQFALMQILSFDSQMLAGIFIQILVFIPLPALFVRRSHDQDRTGLFALVILPTMAFQLYKSIAFASGGMTEELVTPLNPIRLLASVSALAAIALALWPGSSGENRFGPDPREAE